MRAEPMALLAACARVWRVAPLMARPASARAPEVESEDAAEAEPVADGDNCSVAPEPLTAAAELEACAVPAAEPEEVAAWLRPEPREPAAAWANDREVAFAICAAKSDRAVPLITPELAARALLAEGDNALLEPLEPAAAEEVLADCAEEADEPVFPLGLFRAALRAWPAAGELDWEALAIDWLLAAACAVLDWTVELAARALVAAGLREEDALLAAVALLAADWLLAEADCVAAELWAGELRTA